MELDFKGLVYTTTQICNLNCSYCFIANSQKNHNHYFEQHKKITQSLEDNTYTDNYLHALKRLEYSPNNIIRIELWGQETTINLDSFFLNFDYIYKNFPNLKEILFSTNGVAYIDKIVEAIKKADNIVNKPFCFKIQFSYDGLYCKKNRGIDNEIILNNIKTFIRQVNELSLKYVNVQVHLHSVLSKTLMLELDTFEKVDYYWQSIANDIQEILKENIHNQVKFTDVISPAIESPMENVTRDEGLRFFNFFQNSLASSAGMIPVYSVLRSTTSIFDFLQENSKDFDLEQFLIELTQYPINDKNFIYQYHNLSHNCGCNSQTASLKMAYDGTIWHCQNAMFLQEEEDFKNNSSFSTNYFKFLKKRNRYLNILTSPLELVYRDINLYHEYSFTSFGQIFTNILSMMMWCAEAGLIDTTFKNNNYKLLRHAFILSFIQGCPHNNIIETGSMYGRSRDLIMTYCNGLSTMIEDLITANYSFKGNLKSEGK